jgi:very-short-patch-repair endonuclease
MPDEGNVFHDIKGKRGVSPPDAAISRLAADQYGLVTRGQLLQIGLRPGAIDHRLLSGRLHRAHRGVYAVGHPLLTREAYWMAAVLAVGPHAVLSQCSAGAHLGLLHPAQNRIEVTSPRKVRPRSGFTVHRAALPPDEITIERRIPVTTVPRTLLDLAVVLPKRQVERAIEEAERRRLDDPLSLVDLVDLVERYPGRRGTGVIKAILDESRIGSTFTRSELEERFLAFLETHSLRSPELNVPIEVNGSWIEADCVWRRQRVIVELDGHASHGTAGAFERDRARDRALLAAGWRVARVTWRQLDRDGARLATDLRSLLGLATGL